MKENNPMFNPETVIKSIKNQPKQHSKLSKYEKKVIRIINEMGYQDLIWFSGHGDYFVTNTATKKVRNPDFKVHGTNKVIEVGVEYIHRPDFNKYINECTEDYFQGNHDVLVINGEDSDLEIQKNIRNFLHNGLKVNKIKHRKNLRYYKDSKPNIREYTS